MTQENQLTVRNTGDLVAVQPAPIRLSVEAIALIRENIALAEQLVTSTLEKGVDWGPIPGMKGEVLFDPGTSKIMAAFNCYSTHNILFREESNTVISFGVDVQLISRDTRQIVATGIGHASTREKKWGERWLDDPRGYTEEELNQVDQRQYPGKNKEYHVANPNLGDLGFTLLAMACKRGECDAVKSLPGVNSALRKLFDPNLKKTMENETDSKDITLASFWRMSKGVGLTEAEIHRLLGVESVKTWVASGKTLSDGVIVCWGAARTAAAAKKAKAEVKKADAAGENVKPEEITEAQVQTVDALATICFAYWSMTEQQVFKELGYQNRMDFVNAQASPWQAWLTILAVKQPAP